MTSLQNAHLLPATKNQTDLIKFPSVQKVLNVQSPHRVGPYKILEEIGRGSYGKVMAAKSLLDGSLVAIKKISNVFDSKWLARQTLRELKILRLLKHENVLQLKTVFATNLSAEPVDLYLVTNIMHSDLFSIIYSKNALDETHIKFILYQVLRALKYQHSANIIHRDLKPRNILINKNCEVCLCDYGLARFFRRAPGKQVVSCMTDYIVSRWYRAPELLLGNENYDEKVDIWSVGCILSEMFLRRPLFKADDWKNQLLMILDHTSEQQRADLGFIENLNAIKFIKELAVEASSNIDKVFAGCAVSPIALDLIKKMLSFHPDERLSANQALEHPFLREFYCPEDEPILLKDFGPEFEFEEEELTKDNLKSLIGKEVIKVLY